MRLEHSLPRVRRSPSAVIGMVLSWWLLAASTARAQAPAESSSAIVLEPARPPARHTRATRSLLPRLAHLRLEAPKLLAMHPRFRTRLKVERPGQLSTNDGFPWYPRLQLRFVPSRRSTHRPSRSPAADSFLSAGEHFDDVRFSILPIGVSEDKDGAEVQAFDAGFTVVQSWAFRLQFGLSPSMPIVPGLFEGPLNLTPNPNLRPDEQSLTFDAASFAHELLDSSRAISPDIVQEDTDSL